MHWHLATSKRDTYSPSGGERRGRAFEMESCNSMSRNRYLSSEISHRNLSFEE
ncbi:hypothetical protein X777_03651 [Ooceraea biroi]|uniref:Uncharacterized protein n=1 Tax=Ooceraea biroi TaxID=2015173 RepID=A0A026WJY0_OOCBI|nr:hypothetical protein X777_03651 [Ooceraea biroi]